MDISDIKIAVVGLGYVGLPLAVEFAKTDLVPIIGFDINSEKVKKLQSGIDPTCEVGDETVKKAKIDYTDDAPKLQPANFIIVAVPTPINDDKTPDLSLVESASKIVGQNLSRGAVVVYESTVYPGVTEDICLPILEKESGLRGGIDFKIGYSPERVNPGDKEHTLDKIVKVVSGQDKETLEIVAAVYSLVCKAGIHQAPNIKTAEAAKVIENIQRDLNIALINELSLIFEKLEIETKEVLKAAATKWNFHPYYPGLVGGHCIGVDPYYLTFRAQQLGYQPEVILAGRHLNDLMTEMVAKKVIANLENPTGAKILVLGLTFKENVNDFRNSKAKDIIKTLQAIGGEVFGNDSLAEPGQVEKIFGVKNLSLKAAKDLDAIIYLVPHREFQKLTLADLKNKCKEKAVLFDLRWQFDKNEAEKLGFRYLTL